MNELDNKAQELVISIMETIEKEFTLNDEDYDYINRYTHDLVDEVISLGSPRD